MSIRQLYDNLRIFCDEELFLTCIEKMFSSRNWSYWNHLVTFDNILEYSKEALRKSLNDETGDSEVYIRCTTAGKRYLSTFSVHFEFFS